jgi:hypothetical protein
VKNKTVMKDRLETMNRVALILSPFALIIVSVALVICSRS